LVLQRKSYNANGPGVSRGFGFLQFRDVQTAKRFLEDQYPKVRLFGKSDKATEVSISFGRERDDRDRNGNEIEWICGNVRVFENKRSADSPVYDVKLSQTNGMLQVPGIKKPYVFHLHIVPTNHDSEYAIEPVQIEVKNNGDSDVSLDSTPTQFILLRGLEPSVTEDLLAKGVAKLYKSYEPPNTQSKKGNAKVVSTTSSSQFGAQDDSLKRVFIVRDRTTDESWRYGFAEFHSVEVCFRFS
jgi:RNA-binding protein 5/10